VQRIVAGFDGSPPAGAALAWAVYEAHLHGADLRVVTVLVRHPAAGGGASGADPAVAREAAAQVHRLVGSSVAVDIVEGHAAERLVAASEGADLLVVGSRGCRGAAAVLLGSVSLACLHHADGWVAVVPGLGDDSAAPLRGRVVVGVDGSAAGRAALRAAAVEARLRGVSLHAVNAVAWNHDGMALIAPTSQQLVAWGRRLLEHEMHESGVRARPVVVDEHPRKVLVRYSARADLLVLGSRGHAGLAALTLGSTADHCARHARCPVLVVRPGATGDG
jgi:nucleotide-binding universal stress UspA family protein